MESADDGMDPFTRIQLQDVFKGVDYPRVAASQTDHQTLSGANPQRQIILYRIGSPAPRVEIERAARILVCRMARYGPAQSDHRPPPTAKAGGEKPQGSAPSRSLEALPLAAIDVADLVGGVPARIREDQVVAAIADHDLMASGGALAGAVSRAGGLGFIGGGYCDPAWLEREFDLAAGAPVGVGFITWVLAERPVLLDAVLERPDGPEAAGLEAGAAGIAAARIDHGAAARLEAEVPEAAEVDGQHRRRRDLGQETQRRREESLGRRETAHRYADHDRQQNTDHQTHGEE